MNKQSRVILIVTCIILLWTAIGGILGILMKKYSQNYDITIYLVIAIISGAILKHYGGLVQAE